MYYKIWQPGETNISDQWMQTIIKELHQKLWKLNLELNNNFFP
jgi:hypothetical protein